MKIGKIFSMAVVIFLSTTTGSFSHPPREIRLTYDHAAGLLKVSLNHVSLDHLRHYIRKIVVSQNDREVATQHYRQQIDPNDFNQEIPLQAKKGDVLRVTAFCSKGGDIAGVLEITPEMTGEEEAASEPVPPAGEHAPAPLVEDEWEEYYPEAP